MSTNSFVILIIDYYTCSNVLIYKSSDIETKPTQNDIVINFLQKLNVHVHLRFSTLDLWQSSVVSLHSLAQTAVNVIYLDGLMSAFNIWHENMISVSFVAKFQGSFVRISFTWKPKQAEIWVMRIKKKVITSDHRKTLVVG